MATREDEDDRRHSDGKVEHAWKFFRMTDDQVIFICKRCGLFLDIALATLRALFWTYREASKNYRFEFPEGRSKSTVVLIKKKNSGKMKNGKPVEDWVIRFDRPHTGAENPHININPKVICKPDPHTRVPEWAPGAARKTAKTVRWIGKAVHVAGLVVDGIYVGWKAIRDVKNGTTRNTVEAASSVAAGYASATFGYAGGAFFGTLIGGPVGAVLVGVGTAIGLSVAGSMAAEYGVRKYADAKGYDIEEEKCESCKENFNARKYLGEKKCPGCQKKHA